MAELAEDRRPPSLGRQVTDLADRQPKAPAVTCGPDTLDWRGLDRRSNQLARAFANLGVAVGSFVTIALPNSIDFVVACVAAWKLGATPQPVSSRLPQAELQGIVELADPPVVIGTGARYDTARAWLPAGFRPPAETDDGPLPDVVAPSWKAPTSGGSTGRPKLIVSGQPGTYDPIAARFWRCEAPATLLMPGPMYHNGPFCSALPGMMTGAHLVLMERFDPIETLRLVAEHRVTWLYLVPTMMSRIWQLPPEMRDQHDLSSLETVWHLAAPCPAWLKEAWIDWLGAECIWELYGGTEGIATTVISGQEWLAHRGSVGRPVAGEIRILAEDGTEAAPGEIGEVYLRRSPGSPPTYRYIGASARRQGDWESLGDLGSVDAEGYLYLTDRRPDMILVGGSNVYPAEVEAALGQHPLVISSVVIGLPHADLGQRVHALVEARDGLDVDELRQFVADRLVRYKVPRTFELVAGQLRDDAGKVRRSQLVAERTAEIG